MTSPNLPPVQNCSRQCDFMSAFQLEVRNGISSIKEDVAKGIGGIKEDMAGIKADVKSLVGNGQPGRVGVLEEKVSKNSAAINRIYGGIAVLVSILGLVKLFVH